MNVEVRVLNHDYCSIICVNVSQLDTAAVWHPPVCPLYLAIKALAPGLNLGTKIIGKMACFTINLHTICLIHFSWL